MVGCACGKNRGEKAEIMTGFYNFQKVLPENRCFKLNFGLLIALSSKKCCADNVVPHLSCIICPKIAVQLSSIVIFCTGLSDDDFLKNRIALPDFNNSLLVADRKYLVNIFSRTKYNGGS